MQIVMTTHTNNIQSSCANWNWSITTAFSPTILVTYYVYSLIILFISVRRLFLFALNKNMKLWSGLQQGDTQIIFDIQSIFWNR